MTVNHDVAGSSPAGGANEKAGRKTCFFRWLLSFELVSAASESTGVAELAKLMTVNLMSRS